MKLPGFYSSLIAIALPIMLQNLLQTFVNILDTIMIGRLGSLEIAAVGLGNQVFFVLNMILFGITSGGAVFIAQFWGKKDIKGIQKTLGLMIFLDVFFSLIFTIFCLIIPEKIISLYSNDMEVISLGADYLRIVCLSYVGTSISFAYILAFRSTERVKLPLVATAISMVCNIIFNYILIFLFGLGVKGAAIATIISRMVELIVLLGWSISHNYETKSKLKTLLDFDRGFVAQFIKIAFPVIINETFWGLGTSMYNGIFARTSTDAITAFNITGTISQLTWVFFIGLGNGISVVIGKLIGENKTDIATAYAKRSLWFMPLMGAAIGLLLLPISRLLPFFFNVETTIIKLATQMLFVLMLVYPFNAFSMNWIVGVCRAGGDTVFPAAIEIIVMWGISIPLAAIVAFLFNVPPVFIYIALQSESIIKAIIGFFRVLSGKWLRNVT